LIYLVYFDDAVLIYPQIFFDNFYVSPAFYLVSQGIDTHNVNLMITVWLLFIFLIHTTATWYSFICCHNTLFCNCLWWRW